MHFYALYNKTSHVTILFLHDSYIIFYLSLLTMCLGKYVFVVSMWSWASAVLDDNSCVTTVLGVATADHVLQFDPVLRILLCCTNCLHVIIYFILIYAPTSRLTLPF